MRRTHNILSVIIALLFWHMPMAVSAREHINIDSSWRFTLGDSVQMSSVAYDDSYWRELDLPHDWAIEGDFSVNNPSGAGGGALPGGVGWYRKHLHIDAQPGERYFIEFDGVYMNSTVYINGKKVGYRPYGYSSFRYEMTPYLSKSGDNVVAVRVDNSDQPNSRWYSGCGIYRHVWFTSTSAISVAHWGTYVISKLHDNNHAVVNVTTQIESTLSKQQRVTLRHFVIDGQGQTVATSSSTLHVDGKAENTQQLIVKKPQLWSIEHPYLYKVKTEIISGGNIVDTYETTTGIRDFTFNPQTGFSLNGKEMKINGVCLHHDLGCLGAALNEDALHRQLRIMKDMGANAVRCSHNPPAPELLNMCDTMGLIVMDEAFDMWRKKKSRNDYARFFDKWHERDLRDLVCRDRNHPSVMMWSIGNEVLEQWQQADADTLSLEQANLLLNFGHDVSAQAGNKELTVNSRLAIKLADIVRELDPSRPITAGCNEPDPNNNLFRGDALDIIGFNYHHQWIKDVPKNFPDKPFIMTESVSALQTRGYYVMPSDSMILAPYDWRVTYTDPTYKCSAYDNCHVPWGSTHEQTWDVVKHTPWCSGQFLWSGFDYIGEPTPYGYPARSSYFGVVDLAGFPKDSYYMYQSEWTDKTVLHLFPHWNWMKGQDVDMWCYYNNADEVELFVNDKSRGVRRKADSHQYHVMWRVKFEPGTVKVVARKNGRIVGQQTIHTAGAPDHIRITADRKQLSADGKSLSFVTVEVVDKYGNLCPNATNDIHFDVEGPATIAGVDNGSQTSTERFQANHREAFYGKCLVIIKSGKADGKVKLTAKGVDLKSATLGLTVGNITNNKKQ